MNSPRESGMKRPTTLLLVALAEHGPIRNADLARLIGRSPSNTHQALKNLSHRGWARQSDGLWEVTERGRDEPRANPVTLLPRGPLSPDEALARQSRRPWAVLPDPRSP